MPQSHQLGAALLRFMVWSVASTLLKSARKSATTPMMTEKAAMTGPMLPMMSVSFLRPNQTVIMAARAMSAAPTRGSQPRYWLSVVPAPLSMMR